MATVIFNGNKYEVIDTVKFNDTYHVFVDKNGEISFLNRIGESYYEPIKVINSSSDNPRYLEFLRKQHVLYYLVDYIKDNSLENGARIVIEHFKEYIKTSFVNTFLCWPYMTTEEYEKRIDMMKTDLDAFLNQKLQNRILASDKQTIVINDNFKIEEHKVNDDDFVPDPSYESKIK